MPRMIATLVALLVFGSSTSALACSSGVKADQKNQTTAQPKS